MIAATMLMIVLLTLVFCVRLDEHLQRRVDIKQFVLTVTIDQEIFITQAYEYAKRLVEQDHYTVEEMAEILSNVELEKDNPIHIGVMRYVDEAQAKCPVDKFNQASAKLPPADPMKQGVEL